MQPLGQGMISGDGIETVSRSNWAEGLVCSRTGQRQTLDKPAFISPAGAPWLVEYDLSVDRGKLLRDRLKDRAWTLWRYRELLPVCDFEGRVDLGEGGRSRSVPQGGSWKSNRFV
jgi:threonine synthase